MLTTRRLVYVIGVLIAIIAALAWALIYFARDEIAKMGEVEYPAASKAARVTAENGAPGVRLSKKSQLASAIVTRPLAAYLLQTRAEIYGSVVTLQPLVTLRASFLAAQREIGVVQVALVRSAAEYQRMQTLFRDKQMVSLRAVQAAEADWKADQAKRAAIETEIANVRAAARQNWGDVLSRSALSNGGDFTPLLSGQQVLVQLAWGLDQSVATPPARIRLAPVGGEEKPVEAQFVSPATQADAEIAGRTFWYRAPGAGMRVGMRVVASLADTANARSGVSIPASALVWHAGKAWVYVKAAEEEFARREVSTRETAGDDWFNAGAFKPGDALVVSGAQLLLSEEFRFQIKDENDD
ncbi:MAG: hypothetical protein ABIP64_06465 [Burkholderiales bacterium]